MPSFAVQQEEIERMLKTNDYSRLSVIHPGAEIGANVEVGPFVTIHDNVVIGEGTKIMSGVTIFPGARIGRNVTIFPGAVISAIPQDLKFNGEDTVAIIGDNTVLRECATVHRGTASKGKTVVGENCLIMAYSHVAHDCHVKNHVILSNAVQLAGEVIVDDFAIVGGGTLVHQFCHLGAHIMIQGGALINKDIPPFVKAAREPISYAGINTIGLRRRNYPNEVITQIQDIYRCLYLSGKNVADAVANIQAEFPATVERDEIVKFVLNSQRGIIKGYV